MIKSYTVTVTNKRGLTSTFEMLGRDARAVVMSVAELTPGYRVTRVHQTPEWSDS